MIHHHRHHHHHHYLDCREDTVQMGKLPFFAQLKKKMTIANLNQHISALLSLSSSQTIFIMIVIGASRSKRQQSWVTDRQIYIIITIIIVLGQGGEEWCRKRLIMNGLIWPSSSLPSKEGLSILGARFKRLFVAFSVLLQQQQQYTLNLRRHTQRGKRSEEMWTFVLNKKYNFTLIRL